jgi:hypothetical protein
MHYECKSAQHSCTCTKGATRALVAETTKTRQRADPLFEEPGANRAVEP